MDKGETFFAYLRCSTPLGIIGIFTAYVATCVAALIYKSLFKYRSNLAIA